MHTTFHCSFLTKACGLAIIVIVAVNVVVNVENVLDLKWSPSDLHIHPFRSADVPHTLETLCHVPS
jgi:hypothetical protein